MKKKIFSSIFIVFIVIFLISCQNEQVNTDELDEEIEEIETSEGENSSDDNEAPETREVTIKQIGVNELAEMLAEKREDHFYIDVREVHEYEAGHIEGFANFPLSTLPDTFEQLPKDKEIVIICRSGNRSMQAAHYLVEEGFTNLTNVQGAMLEWQGDVVTSE